MTVMYQLPTLSFSSSWDLNLNLNLRLGMRYLFGSGGAVFRLLRANSISAGILGDASIL